MEDNGRSLLIIKKKICKILPAVKQLLFWLGNL